MHTQWIRGTEVIYNVKNKIHTYLGALMSCPGQTL